MPSPSSSHSGRRHGFPSWHPEAGTSGVMGAAGLKRGTYTYVSSLTRCDKRLRVRFPPEVQWNQVKLLVIAMLGDEIARVLQSPGGNPSADTHKPGKIQDFLRQ